MKSNSNKNCLSSPPNIHWMFVWLNIFASLNKAMNKFGTGHDCHRNRFQALIWEKKVLNVMLTIMHLLQYVLKFMICL